MLDLKFKKALENGAIARRKSWDEGMYIYKQIPAEIKQDVIPKMISVPDSVKSIYKKTKTTMKFSNQFVISDKEGNVTYYTFPVNDLLAEDWEIN